MQGKLILVTPVPQRFALATGQAGGAQRTI